MRVFEFIPGNLLGCDIKIEQIMNSDEFKCGGCNWKTGRFFVAAESEEEAIDLLKRGDAGMCAECFAKMLTEEKWELFEPEI
ncbi:MAG: hypothetical protein ACFFBS_08050 [Promethearchaeota archaeon]